MKRRHVGWALALACVLVVPAIAQTTSTFQHFNDYLQSLAAPSSTLGANDKVPILQNGQTRGWAPYNYFLNRDASNVSDAAAARQHILPSPTNNYVLTGDGTKWTAQPSGAAAPSNRPTLGAFPGAGANPVTDYGADPTGVADNASIFQTADNTLQVGGGGIAVLQPGNYKLNTTVGQNSNVTWMFEPGAYLSGAGSMWGIADLATLNGPTQKGVGYVSALNAANGNQFTMLLQGTAGVTGASANYERGGLLVETKTQDPSTSHDLDMVGVDSRCTIATSLGRCFGMELQSIVSSFGDGYAVGAEIGMVNDAVTDQPLIGTTTSKYTLNVLASGSQNTTAGIRLAAGGAAKYHYGLFIDQASIATGVSDYAIALGTPGSTNYFQMTRFGQFTTGPAAGASEAPGTDYTLRTTQDTYKGLVINRAGVANPMSLMMGCSQTGANGTVASTCEIQSQKAGSSQNTLLLNRQGGLVQVGTGGLTVLGTTTLSGNVSAANGLTLDGTNAYLNAPSGNAELRVGGSGILRATSTGLSMLTGTLTGVPTPSAGADAVNKTYADSIASGIVTHAAAAAATTANLNATAAGTGVGHTLTNAGALAAFSVDGYSASVNDRILVKDQTTQKDNGIYTVTTVGSGAVAWVLTRATDFDQASGSEVASGASIIVINGTVGAKTQWVETGQGPFTVDTTAIVFSQIVAASNGTVNSGTTNQLGYYASNGTAISGLATANNGVLVTSAGGVPSIGATIPTAVQANTTQTGTLTAGATGSGFTVDLTASTIVGTLTQTHGGAGTITGALKGNGAGTVSQAVCADLSNGATGCSTVVGSAATADSGTSGHTLGFLDGTNTWSGVQSFNSGDLAIKGATSGSITLNAAAIAGSNTITFPAGTTNFSATGGANQVVQQISAGGALTVGQLGFSNLSGAATAAQLPTFAHTQSTVAAPAGTVSTTGVMMGLAGTITPTASGKVRFSVCGDMKNSTVGDGANVQLRTGTGAAPANGAALTGTTRGSLSKFIAATATGKARTCLIWAVTGLTLSTAVWIDVGLAAVTGGTATISDVDIVADEIP